jgi:hypothetical protein
MLERDFGTGAVANLKAELGRLDQIRSRPAIFKALKITRVEIRHSRFLAYLLNPQDAHGLGDVFLKKFFQLAFAKDPTLAPWSRENIERWDLSTVRVLPEELHVDVLILVKDLGLAVLIENKVDAKEHSRQLQRYWDAVPKKYPWIRSQTGLFLTPACDKPGDERWIPISYFTVVRAGQEALRARSGILNKQQQQHLIEYLRLIREEFVGDPHTDSVAWNIHQQYREALLFVNDNSPKEQVWRKIRSLILDLPGCGIENEERDEIAFAFKEWFRMPSLRDTRRKRDYDVYLLFWFDFWSDGQGVDLCLGADPEGTDVIERLRSLATVRKDLFPMGVHEHSTWPTIWSRRFVSASDLTTKTYGEVMDQVERRWQLFLRDVSRFLDALRKAFS